MTNEPGSPGRSRRSRKHKARHLDEEGTATKVHKKKAKKSKKDSSLGQPSVPRSADTSIHAKKVVHKPHSTTLEIIRESHASVDEDSSNQYRFDQQESAAQQTAKPKKTWNAVM